MRDEAIASLIDRTLQHTTKFLRWHNLAWIHFQNPPAFFEHDESQARATWLAELRHNREQVARHRKEAVEAARQLIPELESIGEDSTNLLKLVHFIGEGGGPDNAYTIWPELKAALQRTAMRLRLPRKPTAPRADTRADTSKKNRAGVPENKDVLRLAKRIKDPRNRGRQKVEIAREFTEHNEKKAQSLLRKLRAFPLLLE